MLEMLRSDLVDYRKGLRLKYMAYLKYDHLWEWVTTFNIQLHGDPTKVQFNGSELININAPIEEMVEITKVEDNSITLFLYNDKEYDHFKELGFNENSFNSFIGLIPYGSYRDKIPITEPVFSIYQSTHDSRFDSHTFRTQLDKNGFRYTIGQNVFCTDVHFYDIKEYHRFKLIMADYQPPTRWFNPYINPGYFKKLFGES